MNFVKTSAVAAMALAIGFTAQAEAGVLTYDLDDAEHARLDDGGFYVRGANDWQPLNFDTNGAGATLTYDPDAGTVNISGQAFNAQTNSLENFNLNYSDVVQDGQALTLNDMGVVGTFGDSNVGGKGFNLTLGDTIRGDGWLTVAGTDQHFGDFHFGGNQVPTGQVPVPSPLLLIAAMAVFFRLRLRKNGAAA